MIGTNGYQLIESFTILKKNYKTDVIVNLLTQVNMKKIY